MNKWLIASLAFFLICITGCSTSEEAARDKLVQVSRSERGSFQYDVQSSSYILRQGDQIQLSVWGYPEFNTTTTVKEGGTLTLPLVGEVPAAGSTRQRLEDFIRKKLAEYIQGEIKLSLTIINMVTQKVTILGAVNRQENYPMTADATLLEVISMAGGVTTDTDLRRIMIVRGSSNQVPLEVDVTSYMENGDIKSIPIVHPGDMVYLPKRANIIREMSDFLRDAIFIFGFFRVFN